MEKHIISKRIICRRTVSVLLIASMIVLSAFMVSSAESGPWTLKSVVAKSLARDIYIDGVHYNNWEVDHPVLVVDEHTTYLPVDEFGNVTITDTGEMVYDLFDFNGTVGYYVVVNGVASEADDVLLLNNGSLYYSAKYLIRLDKLDACYAPESGLYLSTTYKKASEYMDNNPNASYIAGRVAYMMRMNKNLTQGDALVLEYYIRHVAECEKLDCDLLTSMVRIESNFNPKAGTSALGLMQILYKYASKVGMTKEELYDPHINLHYGAASFADGLEQFNGDLTKALCAYNAGVYKVLQTQVLNTAYADRVVSSQKAMVYWIKQNGYETVFIRNLNGTSGK